MGLQNYNVSFNVNVLIILVCRLWVNRDIIIIIIIIIIVIVIMQIRWNASNAYLRS